LNLGEFHGCGAGFVVIGNVIDPRAHGIAPHEPGIKGLQQIGRRAHIVHAGVQPQVIGIWIERKISAQSFASIPHASSKS
jgi:hypothetical protein